MFSRWSILPIAGLLGGVLTSCAERAEDFSEAERESHARMVEVLKEVADETQRTNPYLGTFELENLRRDVAALKPTDLPYDRYYVLVESGTAELFHGYERRSVELFQEAMELVRAHHAEDSRFNSLGVATTVQWLGAAGLRMSEAENCNATPNAESCIFPFSEAAQHRKTEGAELAILHLTRLLTGIQLDDFNHGRSVWLLNLAYMALGEPKESVPEAWRVPMPKEKAPPNFPNLPAFRNVAAEVGLDTFSLAGGSVADDFDGDGDCDLILSSWDSLSPMTFFENDGTGKFSTREAGISEMLGGLNLKQADYDNDGDLDLLVLRGAWLAKDGKHPNSLLKNDGMGNFVDVAFEVGLADESWPTQAADWADYDLDGDLDLFIGNESNGGLDSPCQLFRNDGGHFVDVAAEAGVQWFGYVKGMAWGDLDNDRYPDLFISNLGAPNVLFRNRGDGRFERMPLPLGANAGTQRSFPAWFFDYNNDGWLDIFASSYTCAAVDWVAHYRGEVLEDEKVSALYENQAGQGFVDVGRARGLDAPVLPMGSNYGDLTNNGFPDLYLGSGTPNLRVTLPNTMFINDNGQFYDQTATSRMGHLQKGHAVTFFDFNDDGNLDVFEQMGGAVPGDGAHDVLFENPGFGKRWLKVQLRGKTTNYFGVGCRVGVKIAEPGAEPRWVYQWMNSGGSFGANPLELHFGLGDANRIERIEVDWPVSGKTQVIDSPKLDQRLLIRER